MKQFHLALARKRALTNYFPPLTHDPVGENKKVNAQRRGILNLSEGGKKQEGGPTLQARRVMQRPLV